MARNASRATAGVLVRLTGSLLCLIVAAIHIIDQGGIPGSKTPQYVGIGCWILEVLGLLTAIALLTRPAFPGAWFVAIGVGAGPLIGYVLSRGPGLPSYTDDVGNWLEPLGLLSLAVEATLIVLAVSVFIRSLPTHSPRPASASAAVRNRG